MVAREDALVLDVSRRLPGRGAHLHPDLHCLELAERRRAFARSLRCVASPDTAGLRQALVLRLSPALNSDTAERTEG